MLVGFYNDDAASRWHDNFSWRLSQPSSANSNQTRDPTVGHEAPEGAQGRLRLQLHVAGYRTSTSSHFRWAGRLRMHAARSTRDWGGCQGGSLCVVCTVHLHRRSGDVSGLFPRSEPVMSPQHECIRCGGVGAMEGRRMGWVGFFEVGH